MFNGCDIKPCQHSGAIVGHELLLLAALKKADAPTFSRLDILDTVKFHQHYTNHFTDHWTYEERLNECWQAVDVIAAKLEAFQKISAVKLSRWHSNLVGVWQPIISRAFDKSKS